MISYIEGKIKFINQKSICIMTNTGVGYDVLIDKNIIDTFHINQNIELFIYTHVREDSIELYGFIDKIDKEMFEQLTSISGIGPKSAIQILSLSPASMLYENIIKNNTVYLTQISGIGKKMAEKIVLELRDKLPKLSFKFEGHDINNISENMDVYEALKSMGYSAGEAKEAIANIKDNKLTLQEKIKLALKNVHN